MQSPKVGFFILARDKAQHIRRSVEAALAQTYSPLTIYLSDQGSTDGTAEILDEYAANYSGPHQIVRLHCPDRTPYSMTALIRHLNWAMEVTDCDLILIQSADDYSHPERTEYVVKAWLAHRPAYIGTVVRFEDPDGQSEPTWSAFQKPGFATGKEILDHRAGGSTSCAYDREFWNQVGPCGELMLPDVAFPFLAAQGRGYFLIPEDLAVYVNHKGPQNTGLEGQMRALTDESERLQMNELMACEVTTGLVGLVEPFFQGKIQYKTQEDQDALHQHLFQGAITWAVGRKRLHMQGLRPIGRPA